MIFISDNEHRNRKSMSMASTTIPLGPTRPDTLNAARIFRDVDAGACPTARRLYGQNVYTADWGSETIDFAARSSPPTEGTNSDREAEP